MMHLVCPCLNVTLNVVVDGESFHDSVMSANQFRDQYGDQILDDPFFGLIESGQLSQFVLKNENGIIEKLPALMRKRSIDNKWDIRRCLICGADAYALRSNMVGGQVLVNTKLFIRDPTIIEELRKSAKISPVFQVVLPKTEIIPSTTDAVVYENGFYNNGATTILSRGILQSVQSCISRYLANEQQQMEDRIRVFIEQQQNAYELVKADVKIQKAALLRFVVKNGGGIGNESMNGGGMDDDFDSALPLSPLSMTSGDPSPGLNGTLTTNGMGFGDQAYSQVHGTYRLVINDPPGTPLRPKALSNPSCLNGWKRKRHSGGNGMMTPGLASHAEEQQDIFTFDEQDTIGDTSGQPYPLADDEGNITDDSGTGEDYNKYYPPCPPVAPSAINYGLTNYPPDQACYGASLPVTITARRSTNEKPMVPPKMTDDVFDQDQQQIDVGASILQLALSMQGADDPERLFGERPQRRRWKTGEDQPQVGRQRHYSTAGTTSIVYAKENRNY